MKCVKCERNATGREQQLGRCPGCQHRFALKPQHGITDRFVKSALDRVTANGTLHFLERHLTHELRRAAGRRRLGKSRLALVLALAALGFAGLGIAHQAPWPPVIAAVIIGSILLLVRHGLKRTLATAQVEPLARRFLEVNPQPLLVEPGRFAALGGPSGQRADLEHVSFDRVLICDREEYVDFLLANQLHFHYACPVLGGRGYPEGVCESILEMLRRNPRLDVFLLHDLTPRGHAHPSYVRKSPQWLAGSRSREAVDLGLLAAQLPLLRELLVPLGDIPDAGNEPLAEVPPGLGAELTMLRPQALIRLLARAFDEKQPFHLLAAPATDSTWDSSGSGGYG